MKWNPNNVKLKETTQQTAPADKPIQPHNAETKAIIDNAKKVGKIDADMANDLLAEPTDDKSVGRIKKYIQNKKINPDNLKGQYHPTLLKQAGMSYADIRQHQPGGLSTLRDHAPDVYKAKYFEHNGKMPPERDGKPL